MTSLKPAPHTMLEFVQRRELASRPRRVRVSMPVMLEIGPNCTVKGIIDDISKEGFRLRSRALLHPRQVLKMRLPRETVACELRWTDGLEAGGVFKEESKAPKW
jgi:PilZ domain-containing protein